MAGDHFTVRSVPPTHHGVTLTTVAAMDTAHVKSFGLFIADNQAGPFKLDISRLIAGNKEKEALQILGEGLKGLPIQYELFGREYLHRLEFVAKRSGDATTAMPGGASSFVLVPVAFAAAIAVCVRVGFGGSCDYDRRNGPMGRMSV